MGRNLCNLWGHPFCVCRPMLLLRDFNRSFMAMISSLGITNGFVSMARQNYREIFFVNAMPWSLHSDLESWSEKLAGPMHPAHCKRWTILSERSVRISDTHAESSLQSLSNLPIYVSPAGLRTFQIRIRRLTPNGTHFVSVTARAVRCWARNPSVSWLFETGQLALLR